MICLHERKISNIAKQMGAAIGRNYGEARKELWEHVPGTAQWVKTHI